MLIFSRSKHPCVPSGVTKNCVGTDLVPNTRKNHLAVLSAGAWTAHDLGRMVHDLAAGAGLLCSCVGQSVL
jgi:hypothetical protein